MKGLPHEMGRCVGCDREGPLGAACPESACGKHRLCFIPESDYQRANQGGVERRDPLVGTMVDEWLIVGQVGRGGFAIVYEALQLPEGMRCALKLMQASLLDHEFGDNLVAKFKSEARTLASLSHPNIVRLVRSGMLGSSPYLVMEYIHATSLRVEVDRRRQENRPFTPEEVANIFQQVCRGLHEAHKKGIVHRDIKPENILLQAGTGYEYHVRIVDFGLARFVAEDSRTLALFGTPAYMAPELLLERKVSIATDIFALGAVLYEVLFLTIIAAGATVPPGRLQLPAQTLLDAPAPPGSPVNDAFRAVLKRSMDPRPEQRFGNAREMGAAIARAAGSPHGEDLPRRGPAPVDWSAIQAEETLTQYVGKTVRPRSKGFWGLVVLLFLLVGGAAALTATTGSKRAMVDRDIAGPARADANLPLAASLADIAMADHTVDDIVFPVPMDVTPATDVTPMSGDALVVPMDIPEIRDGLTVELTVPDDVTADVDELPELTELDVVAARPDVTEVVPSRRPTRKRKRETRPHRPRPDVHLTMVADVVHEPPPASPPPTPRLQHVMVSSKPTGATVLSEGRFLGYTPLSVAVVDGQESKLTLQLKGYARDSFAIDGLEGELERVLSPAIWE